jgi:hypothetical protein
MKLNFPWKKIQLINAAKEFAALRLWDQYDNMDLFVVETPIEGPVVGSILGAGGHEFGLCVFRGPTAFSQPFLLSQGVDALSKKGDTIGFSMEYYRDMGPEEKQWFKKANYRANKGDWLPFFIVQGRGGHCEFPEKDKDINLLLHVLKGILSAQKEGLFHPVTTGKTGAAMLTLQTIGNAENPTVKVTHKSFEGSRELLEYCNQDEMFEPLETPDVSKLPKLNQTWVLVTAFIPFRDDREDVCVLAIADEDSGYVLHSDVVQVQPAKAMDVLLAAFSGNTPSKNRGVPRQLIFADVELYDLLNEPLRDMGIRTVCDVNHPVAIDIQDSLENDLPKQANPHFVQHIDQPPVDLSVPPKADDLKGWKAVSTAQTNLFIDFWNSTDSLRKNRPSKKFFGDSEWDYFLDEYRDLLVLPSYVTWLALCYRARKTDATYVEKLLAGNLPTALRMYVEQMNTAYPSLYQISETDAKKGTVLFNDLLLGHCVTAHDKGFSDSMKPGWIVPLWVTSAGAFHFLDVAGPTFGQMESLDVLDELRRLKLPTNPTPLWLRQNAHIFGRLWDFYDEAQVLRQQGPELANTSGDMLELITAQFGCSDPQAVRQALKRRKDMDYDEKSDSFCWFEESAAKTGMRTLLGCITVSKTSVKAEVNSKNRLERLQKILEQIGLVYQMHTSKNAQDLRNLARSIVAPKKSKPRELPKELLSAAQEHLAAYYMDWLDQPIPALNHKTPRQAVKTAKGAQSVKVLIESLSDPIGNCGTVPKEAMLKELGLEGER